jgi:hypothetical protein
MALFDLRWGPTVNTLFRLEIQTVQILKMSEINTNYYYYYYEILVVITKFVLQSLCWLRTNFSRLGAIYTSPRGSGKLGSNKLTGWILQFVDRIFDFLAPFFCSSPDINRSLAVPNLNNNCC